MQKLFFKIILGVSFLTFFNACSEIFENDISGQCVDYIIPQTDDTLSVNNVHFKWIEMEGADNYRIQIVKPSFGNIQEFVVDSLVSGTEVYFTLNPGNYEWQIRGENSAYEGGYCSIKTLYIDSVTDLSSQTISLVSPQDMIYSNQDFQTYVWNSHYAADSYVFDLVQGSINGASISHQSGLTTTSATTNNVLTEDIYYWKVQAINSSSSSMVSSRILNIDKTIPNTASLLFPSNNSNFTDTVVFKWSNGADPGSINSPIKSIIQISTDTLFGSTFILDSTYSDSIQVVFNVNNSYFWRILNRDDANNSGAYSETRKVILN